MYLAVGGLLLQQQNRFFNTQRGISLRAVFFGMTLLLVSGVVRRQAFLYFHQRLEGSRAVRTVFKGSGVGTTH